MQVNVFCISSKSTIKYDTVIQDLLRDRPRQGIETNGKKCSNYVTMARLELTKKQQAC